MTCSRSHIKLQQCQDQNPWWTLLVSSMFLASSPICPGCHSLLPSALGTKAHRPDSWANLSSLPGNWDSWPQSEAATSTQHWVTRKSYFPPRFLHCPEYYLQVISTHPGRGSTFFPFPGIPTRPRPHLTLWGPGLTALFQLSQRRAETLCYME